MLATQLCLSLCDPMDCSPPGSSIHGVSQARILEWVANPFSRGSFRPRDRTQVSGVAGRLFHLSHQGSPSDSAELLLLQRLGPGRRDLPASPRPCDLEPPAHPLSAWQSVGGLESGGWEGPAVLPILLCSLTPSSLVPSGLLVPVPPPSMTASPRHQPRGLNYAPIPQASCLK